MPTVLLSIHTDTYTFKGEYTKFVSIDDFCLTGRMEPLVSIICIKSGQNASVE